MTAVLDRRDERMDTLVEEPESWLPAAGPGAAARQRRYLSSASPWRFRDAARSLTLAVAGLVGVGSCWYGAGGETNLRDQIGWILGSLLAATLTVLAGAIWLISGFREVRHGLRDLALDKQEVFSLTAIAAHVSATQDAHELDFVTAEGMTRLHRRDCLLVKGKQVTSVTHAAQQTLPACGVCLP